MSSINSKKPLKIAFFGTHDFAVTILKGLLDSPLFEIELVITQPDRPVGRKKELQSSPVKLFAKKHGLEIQQPKSLKSLDLSIFRSFDLSVVAQYGLLIPSNIINAPKHGTINVHTSLLPKYRGASPIQSALIDGETKTGVSIMKMDKGMDSGPILLQKEIKILPDETYLELDKRLAEIGKEALLEAIPQYIPDDLKPKAQDESQATFCKKLTREDGKIDWNKTTKKIYNQYRGLTPWPGVWTTWQSKRLKLLKIKPAEKNIDAGKVSVEACPPERRDDILLIGTKDSSVEVSELQLEGKPKMNVTTFLNGYKDIDKQILK